MITSLTESTAYVPLRRFPVHLQGRPRLLQGWSATEPWNGLRRYYWCGVWQPGSHDETGLWRRWPRGADARGGQGPIKDSIQLWIWSTSVVLEIGATAPVTEATDIYGLQLWACQSKPALDRSFACRGIAA